MGEPTFEESTKFRYTANAKLALDNLVAALKASGRVRFNGKKITQEALVNASWLWMRSLDVAELEAALAPHVKELEGMLGQSSAEPREVFSPGLPVEPPAPKPRKKRSG